MNLLKEKYLRSFIGIMTIGILGYSCSNVMTIKNIMTFGGIGVIDFIIVLGCL